VTPTILGGHQENRAAGTASFEVLVSSPSSGSAGRTVGRCSRCSKTPSGTGAHSGPLIDDCIVGTGNMLQVFSFTRFSRPDCRSLQSTLKDSFRYRSP
jgi:hypothetical protein